MPAPEEATEATLTILREWVDKAENDLTAAGQILKPGKAAPMDTICFHVQQCVEKYLKAVLVHRGIPVPKTHNIQALKKMVSAGQGAAYSPSDSFTTRRCPGFTFSFTTRVFVAGKKTSKR